MDRQVANVSVFDTTIGKLIHSPKRLKIMSVLAAADWVAFKRIQEETNLTDADLSRQLSLLRDADLLKLKKLPVSSGRQAWVSLTSDGRDEFKSYSLAMRALLIG